MAARSAPTVVRLFSGSAGGYGHQAPVHSSHDGTFDATRRIAWTGGNAIGFQIRSMVPESDVMASSIELHFIWNTGYIEGEAQSGGKMIPNENRPTLAFVLSPGTRVRFRRKVAVSDLHLST